MSLAEKKNAILPFGLLVVISSIATASFGNAFHSADDNQDSRLSINELLRVVQFYNAGDHHCAIGTEDGFAPGADVHAPCCEPHMSDYSPSDGMIELRELLRAVQFFNYMGYHAQCGSEDNFAPGLDVPQPCVNEGESEEGLQDELATLDGAVVPGEMIDVPAGAFMMGEAEARYRTREWEILHTVCLSAYQIGKYEVTNQEYADMLNWAVTKGYLDNDPEGTMRFVGGTVHSHGQALVDMVDASSNSPFEHYFGNFTVRSRAGFGGAMYSMQDHPVARVSWYGAVAYCNWISEYNGFEPCYDLNTWELHEPLRNGYRLPTEAEWERAAAWDGETHWAYAFDSPTSSWAYGNIGAWDYFIDPTDTGSPSTQRRLNNPIGLAGSPLTSPVGWFNGSNINLLDNGQTVLSRSPVGAFDMSGNLCEWCHDRYASNFYSSSPSGNPAGPSEGEERVLRGGSYSSGPRSTRGAYRDSCPPERLISVNGFRLARTP